MTFSKKSRNEQMRTLEKFKWKFMGILDSIRHVFRYISNEIVAIQIIDFTKCFTYNPWHVNNTTHYMAILPDTIYT